MADPAQTAKTDSPTNTGRDILIRLDRDLAWPTAIVIGLILVVVVNLAFIFVAVSGADPVVPSYSAESR